MARKLRTGFELPFTNIGSNTTKSFSGNDIIDYVWKGLIDGYYLNNYTQDFAVGSPTAITGTSVCYLYYDTNARTKVNLRGGTFGYFTTQAFVFSAASLDLTKFSSGYFCNGWWYVKNFAKSVRHFLWAAYDGTGTKSYNAYMEYVSGSNWDIVIRDASTSTELARSASSTSVTNGNSYNFSVSVDNTGGLTFGFNGITATYASGVSFANWTRMLAPAAKGDSIVIDDLAINDGSGASDNSTPNSIRGYNFFDAATLNTNSGFSAVGGTTVLANLQDGSDSTRASASADLSYIDFSLPTLSGTGMSETAANFTKIEAINVYGRQIEATKASSLLKAKVTDTVAVVNREENLSLPLNVGNDSVSMFDDGSSDWVLANLDSGDMDFRVTFDKP